jgi:hypothetical protein
MPGGLDYENRFQAFQLFQSFQTSKTSVPSNSHIGILFSI